MKRWVAFSITIAALIQVVGSWAAESTVFVTAKDLIAANHRFEIEAGTEVVWGDPHVDRVWFPPNSGIQVRRTNAGLAATFPQPGRYEGRLTLAGTLGRGAADVMPMLVIVKSPAR